MTSLTDLTRLFPSPLVYSFDWQEAPSPKRKQKNRVPRLQGPLAVSPKKDDTVALWVLVTRPLPTGPRAGPLGHTILWRSPPATKVRITRVGGGLLEVNCSFP